MATHDFSIQDVEKVVTGIDGEIKKVDISRLTLPGENYLSLVFRVDFEVEKNGKIEIVSAVAKRLPLGNKKFDFSFMVMKNEIRWYSEMVPLLKEFAKEINVDIDYYPDYLGGRFNMDSTKTDVDEESVLLLRNLIPDGYKNEDRYIGFDLISAKALLSALANFHAVPLVMKYKRPDLAKIFKDFIDSCFKEQPQTDGSDSKHGPPGKDEPSKGPPADIIYDTLLGDPLFVPYKEKLEISKKGPHGPEIWRKPGIEPWNTIIHSDFWLNNAMVKPREGEAPLVKIVDFQFINYSSYAKDVVTFLLTSIRNDVMKQHFDDLLRHYYEELTSIIQKAGVSDLRLTYEEYLEELKRVAIDSEMNHAIFFSSLVFGEKENVPDIQTGEIDMISHMANMARHLNDKQRERLMIIFELTEARGWF